MTAPEPKPMSDERLAHFRRTVEHIQRAGRKAPYGKMLADAVDEIDRLRAELAASRAEKDNAYSERNKVVAALAKLFPSGVAVDPEEPEWPVVYIDLPDGQASWHFQRSELENLLPGIRRYDGEWDGHSTEEKYRRLAAMTPAYFNLSNYTSEATE